MKNKTAKLTVKLSLSANSKTATNSSNKIIKIYDTVTTKVLQGIRNQGININSEVLGV